MILWVKAKFDLLKREKKLLDLSISIISWNTKDILRNCLMSIYESTHKLSYEIFMVDNGSSDGSPGLVEKEFPQVKIIKQGLYLDYLYFDKDGCYLEVRCENTL